MSPHLLALCLLCLSLSVEAATLSGFSSDAADGEALPNTTVSIPALSLGTLSNASGYYALRGVPAGTHIVVFSHIGYRTRRDTLSLAADQNLRLDVALRTEAIQVEQETLVTAERPEEEERARQTSFLSLPAERLQSLPAAGEPDLLRSLHLLPGIQSASDISSGLYIRGGGPDQTLILLDQVPLYNPSHAFGFFSTFNPDAVRDVQLYKGAYPAAYGGNLGAVLDVSNREGNNQSFRSSGGLSLIAGRLLVEGPTGRGSWMLSGRRTYLDPVLAAARASGLDVPDYYFYDFNGKLSQKFGDDALIASTYWGSDDLVFDLDAETFIDVRWGNRALTGRWAHLFSPALFGRFMVAYSAYESDISVSLFDTPARFSNSIRDLSLKGDLDYFASPAHTLTTGFLLTRYEFGFLQKFNQQVQLDLQQTPHSLSLYAQDDWQPIRPTRLRLGARLSYFSEGDHYALMPRFSISHALRSNLRLKLGGGLYRQYLQLVTTEGFSGGDFWVPLDGSVEPGRSRQGVFGLEWEPSPRYLLSAETYYNDLASLVVLDNDTVANSRESRSADIFKTGGTGYATGLELFFERRAGRLRGWLGYTLGLTRRRFPDIDQGRSFPPKYDRRHDLSLVLSYHRARWVWSSSFVYATGQAYTPATARYTLREPATGLLSDRVLPGRRNSARLLPYHRLDLGLRRQLDWWGTRSEVYLQIFNVYSRRNEWFVQYNTDNPTTEPEVFKMLPIVPTFGLNFEF